MPPPPRKFRFRGSRYPEIDAEVADFVNGRLAAGEAPQSVRYKEVEQLVEKANEEKGLYMPKSAVASEAMETHEKVVTMITMVSGA